MCKRAYKHNNTIPPTHSPLTTHSLTPPTPTHTHRHHHIPPEQAGPSACTVSQRPSSTPCAAAATKRPAVRRYDRAASRFFRRDRARRAAACRRRRSQRRTEKGVENQQREESGEKSRFYLLITKIEKRAEIQSRKNIEYDESMNWTPTKFTRAHTLTLTLTLNLAHEPACTAAVRES